MHLMLVRVWTALALATSAMSFASAPALAQPSKPFFGSWVGTLEQKTPGGRGYTSFTFNIVIGPNGNQIGGTTRVDSPDNKTHYVTNLTSVGYTPPVLRYTDSPPVYAEPSTAWCTKQVALNVAGDDLSGTWTAPGCNTGTLHVRPLKTVYAEDLADPAAHLFRYRNPTGEQFLFLKLRGDIWRVLPAQIDADDLASLKLGPEMQAAFVVNGSESTRMAAGPDGVLYLLQGSSAWPLHPRDTPDLDMTAVEAGSTWHADLQDGVLPNALVSDGGREGVSAGNSDAGAPAADSDASAASNAEAPGGGLDLPQSPTSADAVQPPASEAPAGLTDDVRQAVAEAIHRANAAWAQAKAANSNDPLNGNVAGQELANDQQEIANNIALGRIETPTQLQFSIGDMSMDSPGHVTAHTIEIWSVNIKTNSGQAIVANATASYNEIYTVEFQNGMWIVTLDEIV